jgi:hypothetical protein
MGNTILKPFELLMPELILFVRFFESIRTRTKYELSIFDFVILFTISSIVIGSSLLFAFITIAMLLKAVEAWIMLFGLVFIIYLRNIFVKRIKYAVPITIVALVFSIIAMLYTGVSTKFDDYSTNQFYLFYSIVLGVSIAWIIFKRHIFNKTKWYFFLDLH